MPAGPLGPFHCLSSTFHCLCSPPSPALYPPPFRLLPAPQVKGRVLVFYNCVAGSSDKCVSDRSQLSSLLPAEQPFPAVSTGADTNCATPSHTKSRQFNTESNRVSEEHVSSAIRCVPTVPTASSSRLAARPEKRCRHRCRITARPKGAVATTLPSIASPPPLSPRLLLSASAVAGPADAARRLPGHRRHQVGGEQVGSPVPDTPRKVKPSPSSPSRKVKLSPS